MCLFKWGGGHNWEPWSSQDITRALNKVNIVNLFQKKNVLNIRPVKCFVLLSLATYIRDLDIFFKIFQFNYKTILSDRAQWSN